MIDDIDDAVLVRYFAGTASRDDEARVESWVRNDPARATLLEQWREAWNIAGSDKADPSWDVERALDAVKRRAPIRAAAPPRNRAPHAAPRWRWWSLAAAVVVAAAGGLVWGRVRSTPPGTPDPMRAYTTGTGQQAKLTLGDGSLVTLGVRSTLRVPSAFGRRARDVFLDGEAYFEVAHDAALPFTVHSGRAEVRVLGTRFDVRDRIDDAAATVAVASGRVRLAPPPSDAAQLAAVELVDGDVGRLTSTGAEVQHGSDVRALVGWRDGRIAFIDAPLPEVLAELERWYDVSLQVGDARLAARRLTTTLQHETVDEMLAVLEAALEARARRDISEGRRVITLHSRAPR